MTTLINTSNITDGTLAGTGSFDLLMKSVKAHIESEYDNGRIIGADYASVYLGALQTVLAQSVQFELSKGTAEAQTDLLREQLSTQIGQTALIMAQIANTEANTQVLLEKGGFR